MRGRLPKPLNLKMLQGNAGHRPLAPRHTGFVAGTPAKPSWLDKDGSAEWERLVKQLSESGVLSTADGGIVACACEHFSAFRKASRFLKKRGETYQTRGKAGTMTRLYPQVRLRMDALRAYQRAIVELGATPSQHPRVHRLPGEEPDRTGAKRFFT